MTDKKFVDPLFLQHIHTNNLEGVIQCLENGANVRIHGEAPIQLSAEYGHKKIIAKLLEYGADIHCNDDYALRYNVRTRRLQIVSMLLKRGANVHCKSEIILKNLHNRFNEELADIILPYCDADVHHYFPDWYITKNIIPTKNAATIQI